jgi:hypothetical protein
VNTDVTVRILVFALALIAIVLVANTRNNMANIITDLMGGISNLWTKEPTNVKEYIISKLDLQNVDLLDEFTQQTKMIESSGGTDTVAEESSARGDFQFLTEGEGNAFQTGLNRVASTYDAMDIAIPKWVSTAQEHNNPEKLSSKQQEELFLANLWQQSGTSKLFQMIDEGDGLAKYNLYAKYHHTNPDEATISNALSAFNL